MTKRNTAKIYNPLTEEGKIAIICRDKVYLETFCQKYGLELVNFSSDSEEFPSRGLMYVFSNLGGGNLSCYTLRGIKNGLGQDW